MPYLFKLIKRLSLNDFGGAPVSGASEPSPTVVSHDRAYAPAHAGSARPLLRNACMLILLLGLMACADAGDPTNPDFQSSSVVALGVWPQNPTIAVGDSLDFMAFGLTAAGDTVTLDVTWSANGGEIRGNGKGKGRYNARAVGRNKVKATRDSLSDSTTVTVTDVPVA